MLRYWSVLLYIVLILGSISLGGYFNQEDQNDRVLKSISSRLLDLKVNLELDELFIVKSPSWFFTAIVVAIFATGILSLLAHFYLVKHQRGPALKSKDEEIELCAMNTDE